MMNKIILYTVGAIFLSNTAVAQIQILTPYPVNENLAYPEKVLQTVYAQLSGEDDKEKNEQDKKKIEMRDPKKDSAEVKTNQGNPESSEFPPYGDEKLRAALAKKEPSIPEVESVIKETFVYQSETLNETGNVEVDKKSSDTSAEAEDGTLEKLQMQTILTYENGRALARRALDLIEKAQKDAEEIKAENDARTTTGSIQKGMQSSVMFRTQQLLNEIATLRNSYIEINAINTIQGTEVSKSGGLVEDVLNTVTGG